MLSNGKLPDSKVLLEYALPAITSKMREQKTKKVVVIPYAVIRMSYDERVASVRESLQGLDVEVIGIHEAQDPVAAIYAADAIMVSGGNTWQLNKMLHDNGLIEPIRDAVFNLETIYVGWSAGTVICGPNMCTTNDMCIVDAAVTSSLNLVPFQINPHYIDASIAGHMGETRDERILEFNILNPHKNVLAIPEGTWLELNDAGLSYHSGAKKSSYLFTFGEEKQVLAHDADLNFLMKDRY